MLIHCNMRVRPEEIQFLFSNEDFTHRKLEITHCPKCDKLLAKLVEKRIIDGKMFETQVQQGKAHRLINSCKNDIEYTSLDCPKGNKTLFGFRYGENKEKINKKTKEVTLVQKSCDFFGNKEIVKKFKTD